MNCIIIQWCVDSYRQNNQVKRNQGLLKAKSLSQNRVLSLIYNEFDLNFHPFRMHIQHQLLPGDYQRRIDFSDWFLIRLARTARFHVRELLFGDEATFRMNEQVKTWNIRSYAPRNHSPANFTYNRNCSQHKVTVWAGLFGGGEILGPYCFE